MKSNDDFDDAKRIGTQLVILLLFFMLVGVGLYYAESYFSAKEAPKVLFISIFLMLFGIIHILFSKALSFLYNMQKKIIPFSQIVTPKFLQIFGVVVLCGGVGVFFCYM